MDGEHNTHGSADPSAQAMSDDMLLDSVLQDIASENQREKVRFQTPAAPAASHAPAPPIEPEPEYEDDIDWASPMQTSPMDEIKESVKWSLVAGLIVFLFMQPSVVQGIVSYAPSRLVTDGSLNTAGTAGAALLGALFFFILFYWVF